MDINELKDKLFSALGQVGESAKGFAGKAADATKDLYGKASDKAKAGARIAKLNIEISQEKENMRKTYLEIGKLYYDTHKNDPDGFFIQLCEEIDAAAKSIAEKEAEIADLKESSSANDVEVEFEEIVEQDEAAVEGCACENVCECAEEAAETVCDCVEKAAESVCECAAEAAEPVCECCKEASADIEADLKKAADVIEEKLGETEE